LKTSSNKGGSGFGCFRFLNGWLSTGLLSSTSSTEMSILLFGCNDGTIDFLAFGLVNAACIKEKSDIRTHSDIYKYRTQVLQKHRHLKKLK